jgi:hypothetical protein
MEEPYWWINAQAEERDTSVLTATGCV